MDDIEVPTAVIIDTLRGEVANLNDVRLQLIAQVTYLQTVVEGLSQQIHDYQHRLGETHGEEGDHDGTEEDQ